MRGGLIIATVLVLTTGVFAEQRFAVPTEFDSGYTKPTTQHPDPRASMMQYVDLGVLIATLGLASFLTLKFRRRWAIFTLMIFCLVYFGFVRGGCVCPIGAIQNVAMAIFLGDYTLPLVVLAIFVIPLVFTLLLGRAFCGAVCPLGAVQDVFLLRPLRVPGWLDQALGLLAYIYLAAAVLLAATGSALIICRYDPFVSLFRLLPLGKWIEALTRGGTVPGGIASITISIHLLVLLGVLVVICMFVGRAYCRFLCPYGAILRICSRLSLKRVTITPEECIKCRLCEDACHFGAIRQPTQTHGGHDRTRGKGLLAGMVLLAGALTFAAGWGASLLTPYLARTNAQVRLAEQIWREQNALAARSDDINDPGEVFRRTDTPIARLYDDAEDIKRRFLIGSWIAGGFIGLVIGGRLVRLSVRRRREDYEADRGSCLACGRCFAKCPMEQARRKGRSVSLTTGEDE